MLELSLIILVLQLWAVNRKLRGRAPTTAGPPGATPRSVPQWDIHWRDGGRTRIMVIAAATEPEAVREAIKARIPLNKFEKVEPHK